MNTSKYGGAALLSAGILAMVTALGAGTAHADPPSGTFRNLSGVGSDTTTPVIQALAESNVAEIAGIKQMASYNATPADSMITTKDSPSCTIPRPNGSSSGRTAFVNALNGPDATGLPAGTKCLQFARSSDINIAATTPNIVYIPFAGENVTYAPNNTSNLPKNIPTVGAVPGLDRLRAYYNCAIGTALTLPNTGAPFGPSNPIGYRPMIPQLGSGTAPHWIKTMYNQTTVPTGINVTEGGCVQVGVDEFGALIQEHNGTQVNGQEMVNYSVAQWTSQTAGVIAADVRGNTRLGQIGSANPFGAGFPINRPLFNAIKEDVADGIDNTNFGPELRTVFVDMDPSESVNTALLCSAGAAAIMSRFGLTVNDECGQNLQANTSA